MPHNIRAALFSEFFCHQFAENGIQLGIDHIKVRHRIHNLIVDAVFAGALEVPGQVCHFLGMGIVVAHQVLHHHQQFFQRGCVLIQNMGVLLFSVDMGMGQTTVGMGTTVIMKVNLPESDDEE